MWNNFKSWNSYIYIVIWRKLTGLISNLVSRFLSQLLISVLVNAASVLRRFKHNSYIWNPLTHEYIRGFMINFGESSICRKNLLLKIWNSRLSLFSRNIKNTIEAFPSSSPPPPPLSPSFSLSLSNAFEKFDYTSISLINFYSNTEISTDSCLFSCAQKDQSIICLTLFYVSTYKY